MTEKHSPEPWSRSHCTSDGVAIYDSRGMSEGIEIGMIEEESDAKRIVACVNACKGINPEAVPALLKAAERMSWLLDNVESCIPRDECDSFQAAIEKSRGVQS